MFNKIFLGVGITMIVGSLLTNVYLNNRLNSTQERLEQERALSAQLERTNAQMVQTMERFQADLEANRVELRRVNGVLSSLQQEQRERERELQRAMGRQETVFRRPTLVERMAQRSFTEFTDRYSCATGAKERCTEEQQEPQQ